MVKKYIELHKSRKTTPIIWRKFKDQLKEMVKVNYQRKQFI